MNISNRLGEVARKPAPGVQGVNIEHSTLWHKTTVLPSSVSVKPRNVGYFGAFKFKSF